jgi:hypothetical protein
MTSSSDYFTHSASNTPQQESFGNVHRSSKICSFRNRPKRATHEPIKNESPEGHERQKSRAVSARTCNMRSVIDHRRPPTTISIRQLHPALGLQDFVRLINIQNQIRPPASIEVGSAHMGVGAQRSNGEGGH